MVVAEGDWLSRGHSVVGWMIMVVGFAGFFVLALWLTWDWNPIGLRRDIEALERRIEVLEAVDQSEGWGDG